MLSALIAPASMLAEEVRTGKLGGVCLANKANKTDKVNTAINGGESGSVTPSVTHCDSCGSLVIALPFFAAQHLPSEPSQQVAGVALPFDAAAAISGLPPSRGPPAL